MRRETRNTARSGHVPTSRRAGTTAPPPPPPPLPAVDLKKANPNFPILVREAEGVEPRLVARYDRGVEKAVSVAGLSRDQVGAELEKLVAAGGK